MKKHDLIINVNSLQDGENKFSFAFPAEFLNIKYELDHRVILKATIYKKNKKLKLVMNVSFKITLICSLCIEKFHRNVNTSLTLYLIPFRNDNKTNTELEKKDLLTEQYKEEINLLQLTKEMILLWIPIAPKCKVSCKGLCPTCGINLNKNTCNCKEISKNNAFLKLSNLIKNERN